MLNFGLGWFLYHSRGRVTPRGHHVLMRAKMGACVGARRLDTSEMACYYVSNVLYHCLRREGGAWLNERTKHCVDH